jgi:hypothetical protein
MMRLMLPTRLALSKLCDLESVNCSFEFWCLGLKMFLEGNLIAMHHFSACEPVPTMEMCNIQVQHLNSVVGC